MQYIAPELALNILQDLLDIFFFFFGGGGGGGGNVAIDVNGKVADTHRHQNITPLIFDAGWG